MEGKRALILLAFYSALFSIFAVLTVAYSLNLIYLIGDERQNLSLFLGLILGSFIYSLLGSVKKVLIPGILLAALSVSIAAYMIFSKSMVIDNLELFISSFFITSPLMPMNAYFSRYREKFTVRLSFSILTTAFFLVIIAAFAIVYMYSNQTILPLGISVFAYTSIALSFLLTWRGRKKVNQ